MEDNFTVLQAAFDRVADLEALYGDAIPYAAIREGFAWHGETLHFETKARGIFKPRQMSAGVLSIKTTVPRGDRVNIYNDQLKDDGFYHYSLQAGNTRGGANKLLWQSCESQQPFIYFHAVAPAVYKALWPCFIETIVDDMTMPYARVFIGTRVDFRESNVVQFPEPIDRRYMVRESKIRLHQASFREMILNAYGRRCAITGMKEERLIEAAHIIPDAETSEKQFVHNGIALSRIHHKAYDARLISIDPDYKIHVSDRLKEGEVNEFMDVSFRKIEGMKLHLPRDAELRPNRNYLARNFEKYELFGTG